MDSSITKSGPAREPTDKVRDFKSNTSDFRPGPRHQIPPPEHNQDTGGKKLGESKKPGPKKRPVLWVDLFRCFLCQKEGRSPPLRRCSQCEVAYYCSKTCQRGHWKLHKPACIAAVAAKADDATRERLARAVRSKDKAEGGEDDALCVICLGPPMDPIEVRLCSWVSVSRI